MNVFYGFNVINACLSSFTYVYFSSITKEVWYIIKISLNIFPCFQKEKLWSYEKSYTRTNHVRAVRHRKEHRSLSLTSKVVRVFYSMLGWKKKQRKWEKDGGREGKLHRVLPRHVDRLMSSFKSSDKVQSIFSLSPSMPITSMKESFSL